MKKFGDYDGLSEFDVKNITEVISTIESKNIQCVLFFGFPLIEIDQSTTIMKGCIISTKGIIILHNTDDEKKVYWRHINKTIMESPSISDKAMCPETTLVFFNKLDDVVGIMNKLNASNDVLSQRDVDSLIALIQKAFHLSKYDKREVKKENSIGEIIKRRNNKINILDENQFEAIYKTKFQHSRIRGLAGSGKTILLVKKMAYLHYRYPELNMVYVFYTISLKQFIEKLFITYYKEFDPYNEPDMSKIFILHSWGSKNIDGFYSTMCKKFLVRRKTFQDVVLDKDKLGSVCSDLLNQIENLDTGLYDYVFIDEAQDFTLPFYKLVLKSLKPTGKMIYAYDELQSLNVENKMPSKYNIFGNKKCEDINLSICYRTPKEILVTAHALGLGVYKKKEDGSSDIVNMIQDLDTWKAIGYDVVGGDLAFGKKVILSRKDVIDDKCDNSVVISEFENVETEYEFVTNEILELLLNQDVDSDDIMIIDLDSINLNDNFTIFKNIFCKKAWDDKKQEWISSINLVNKDNAIKFRMMQSIPYTTIFRAKGNEANIVFVLNAHKLQSISSYNRNRIFTAMTRARFKVYLLGAGDMKSLIDEAMIVKENDYKLNFVYPTKAQLKEISTIAKTEIKTANDYASFVEFLKTIKNNSALLKEILIEELGIGSLDNIAEMLKETQNEE